MPTSRDDVAHIYGKISEYEHTRLATHPMERELTLRAIRRGLGTADDTSPKRIADIGGGPGKLAFELADEGHQVDLIDLSPDMIRLAQAEQNERASGKAQPLLSSIAVGNALDKLALPHDSYDAVLLLGPLYHLVDESERIIAVNNALDLAKRTGGLVFCAFVTVEAHLRDIAVRNPARLVREKDFYAEYLTDGRYQRVKQYFGVKSQSFHTRSGDVRKFFASHFADKAELVEVRSTEGILGGGLDAKFATSSGETVKAWANLLFDRFSTDEEHLGCADHLLAVLRRK